MIEQEQCHLFREANDKNGNYKGYKTNDGKGYHTMPASFGYPAQVYIINPFCLCGPQYWKGDREVRLRFLK